MDAGYFDKIYESIYVSTTHVVVYCRGRSSDRRWRKAYVHPDRDRDTRYIYNDFIVKIFFDFFFFYSFCSFQNQTKNFDALYDFGGSFHVVILGTLRHDANIETIILYIFLATRLTLRNKPTEGLEAARSRHGKRPISRVRRAIVPVICRRSGLLFFPIPQTAM